MEMANTGPAGDPGDLSPSQEIALRIAEIEARHAAEEQSSQPRYGSHPADMILSRLGDVDARQKDKARSEIDGLASLIAHKASADVRQTPAKDNAVNHAVPVAEAEIETPTVETPFVAPPATTRPARHSFNPFAPVREPTPQASTWLLDVFTAAEAEQKHKIRAGMSPVETGTDEDVAEAAPVQPILVAKSTSEPVASIATDSSMLDFPNYGRARADEIAARYSDIEIEEVEVFEEAEPSAPLPTTARDEPYNVSETAEETDQAADNVPAVAARQARPSEKPSWLLYGVPVVTMVSLVALAFAIETSDSVAVRAAPSNANPASVATAPAPETVPVEVETATLEPVLSPADTRVAENVEPGRTEAAPAEPTTPEAASIITPEVTQAVTPAPEPAIPEPPVFASAPTPRPAAPPPAVEPAPVSLADIRLVSAPSLKPDIRNSQPLIHPEQPDLSASSVMASTNQPRNTIPARLFSGPIEAGSAAALVTQSAQSTGPELTKTEQFWLARDVERVLENEIDGRTVSVTSRQGQRVRVFLETSKQGERKYSLTRSEEMGALPFGLVLDGGWFAAKNDVALSATAALGSEFRHRQLKQDMLIERIGVYTGRHGDRWYLMGQRGVAVGFVSAADVVHAGASPRPLGLPYHQSQSDLVTEERVVYTRCREGFIGPEGGSAQKLSVCRNAEGHWIDADKGLLTTKSAGVYGGVSPSAANTPSKIFLAEASSDPVAYHTLANRFFRRRFQDALADALKGQMTRQALPDGSEIRFTFGDKYETIAQVPIKRVAAMAALKNGLRVKARWMIAPAGAYMHATPDHLVIGGLGNIPPGRAVEAMGEVVGRHGDDWTLVGRKGVALGYVETASLVPLTGQGSPTAVSASHTSLAVDLVKTVTFCRNVTYETIDATGEFSACQQLDGTWTVLPEVRSRFADASSATRVAP